MTDTEQEPNTQEANKRVQSLLAAFRQIGVPLLQSLVEVSGALEKADLEASSPESQSEDFNKLVDSTILLSQEIAKEIGANEGDLDAMVRWALAGSASQVVAASYHARGTHMTLDVAQELAQLAAGLQSRFKVLAPESLDGVANTSATFRAKMLESMVTVIGAVAQYAFNRAEHELLAEIAERLVKTADQVTRALAPAGASPEQWRQLCWNILQAAGRIYTECHYAEADRLQYMEESERAAYFAQHGEVVPMTQVWQAFNQRMAMLATLSTYLDVPASARLDEQEW